MSRSIEYTDGEYCYKVIRLNDERIANRYWQAMRSIKESLWQLMASYPTVETARNALARDAAGYGWIERS